MANRKQLLFVDDDERLLDGLKRLLRKKRKEWEMFFAHSGVEAIEIIKQEDISVIVADMRMPGMDGPSVLNEVTALSPHTIRFILSGQACKSSVMKVIDKAHIFLSKPCEKEVLLEVLERACTLNELISNSEILTLATKMGSLPSMPVLYEKLVNEINSEEASLDSVGNIMATDPGMCTKVLQLVNSAFFSLPRQVTTAQQAVNMLGMDTISVMVLAEEVFGEVDSAVVKKFKLDALWSHVNRTSVISAAIARQEGLPREQVCAALTAGLLHEVGTLAIVSHAPGLYQQAIDMARDSGISLDQAERETYQTTSAEVGAYLLGLWGLPSEVIRGVAYHRQPGLDNLNEDDSVTTAAIVHVACVFDDGVTGSHTSEDHFDVAGLKKLGVMDRLAAWQEAGKEVLSGQD